MREDQHDAHVVAWLSRKAVKEAKVMAKIAATLEGMNSDQVRRIINAAAAFHDIDLRIPVPRP